ncbi:MAG: hypothetical protein ACMUJM_04705 [bacterium]
MTSEKKLKKIYPAAAAFFFYSTQWQPNISSVFENSVVLETGFDFFFRDNYKNEVDVIVPIEDKGERRKPFLIPIEIKFSDTIKLNALNPIQLFMKRNKIKRGIIATKNCEKEVTYNDMQLMICSCILFPHGCSH